MNNKKIISFALVLVLITTMFVGCNSKKKDEPSTINSSIEEKTSVETVNEFVTNDKGETVTNDKGEALTTEVTKVVTVSQSENKNVETSSKKTNSTTTKASINQTETTTKKNTPTGSSNKTTTTKPVVTECSHTWSSWKNNRLWYQERECTKCGDFEEREIDNRDSFMGSKSEYLDLLKIINAERSKNGLIPFAYKSEWQAGADQRAKELIVKFSHTRPDGRKATTAYTDLGFDVFSAGENIAKGYSNPQSVFNAWMNSEGHRNALMANGNNEQIEVCIARCNNCWVISFLVY